MRTLVDIPNDQIDDLAVICEAKKVSRTEVVRQAISAYIATHKSAPVDAFGLWKSSNVSVDGPLDGMAYQEQVRSEW